MRCRLFIAAVQHHLCQFKESMMSLERVVQINKCYSVFNNPESRMIAGITHFIRGMNLMKLHRFPDAYLSLSRAQVIPGYSEKAREIRREAVIGFTRIEAAEFDHSPAASTHALLDWEDSEPRRKYSWHLKHGLLVWCRYCGIPPVHSLIHGGGMMGRLGIVLGRFYTVAHF